MSAQELNPGGANSSVGNEAALQVKIACNISLEKAISLLQRYGNDPEKAIVHHRTLMRYMTPSTSVRAKSSTHSGSSSPVDRSVAGDDTGGPVGLDRPIIPPRPSQSRFTLRDLEADLPEGSSARTERLPPPPPYLSADLLIDEPDSTPLAPSDSAYMATHQRTNSPEIEGEVEAESDTSNANETTPESTEEEVPEWDYNLPWLPRPPVLSPGLAGNQHDFNIDDLIGAIQHDFNTQEILNYLGYYDKYTVKRFINETVSGFPAMFYIISKNQEWLLRLWVSYGGDVSIIHEQSATPLLAYAIICGEILQIDTTLLVTTLLSLGASPLVVPPSFYTPFHTDLAASPELEEEDKTPLTAWCNSLSTRTTFAKAANLTHRYFLYRASKTKKPSIRHRQIALRRNAEPLLGLPYFLIGQTLAASRLLQKLLSHLMITSRRPLVLVFAGPSGHGKTELARRLGHLLSLDLEVVDCTIFSRENELFGPRHPYVGAERGSPLNNFLANNAGKRCVVFLDEFEKTTAEVHKALLLPFDNGEYQDRRHLTKIDCSKTIWILATNACDPTIQSFCTLHHTPLYLTPDNEPEKLTLMKTLSTEIKESFLSQFDSPITGRISAFIPFLPFSTQEAAVVVHKYLLQLATQIARPVSLRENPEEEQLLGNVRLRVRRDATVCMVLAKQEYHAELGARSLITAVKGVEDLVVERYLDVDEEIRESVGARRGGGGRGGFVGVGRERDDERPEESIEFWVDVRGGEVVGDMVKVKRGEERGEIVS